MTRSISPVDLLSLNSLKRTEVAEGESRRLLSHCTSRQAVGRLRSGTARPQILSKATCVLVLSLDPGRNLRSPAAVADQVLRDVLDERANSLGRAEIRSQLRYDN
jgi:hypothetical protein